MGICIYSILYTLSLLTMEEISLIRATTNLRLEIVNQSFFLCLCTYELVLIHPSFLHKMISNMLHRANRHRRSAKRGQLHEKKNYQKIYPHLPIDKPRSRVPVKLDSLGMPLNCENGPIPALHSRNKLFTIKVMIV